jgi:hypothetical protein
MKKMKKIGGFRDVRVNIKSENTYLISPLGNFLHHY